MKGRIDYRESPGVCGQTRCRFRDNDIIMVGSFTCHICGNMRRRNHEEKYVICKLQEISDENKI